MTVTYHRDFDQGSGEWLKQRCGMLTSSAVKHILTPTLKTSANDKTRQHLYELLAQRATGHVEPQYISDDMLRGESEEITARDFYSKHYAPVEQCGFITNDKLGFAIGCSPDGLVGDDGMIEIKSRRQKYQAQTIVEGIVPDEFVLQIQCALLVSERKWCDFISYCGGMPMFVLRVLPDLEIMKAIEDAALAFEVRLVAALKVLTAKSTGLHATERRDYEEITL